MFQSAKSAMPNPILKGNDAMIRSILIAAGFLSVTIVLVALQPASKSDRYDDAVVTRNDTDLTRLQSAVSAAQSQPQAAAEPAQGASTAAALAAISGKTPPPEAKPDMFLKGMSTGVLSELGIDAGQKADPAEKRMRDMTAGILADIKGTSGKTTNSRTLQTLVAQALREGQSDSYIDTLLNEAASKGDVAVPAALVTSSGRVDTSTLLASIVAEARKTNAPDTAPQQRPTVQAQTYVVRDGESLGGIAQRIYGDASYYTTIFQANRAALSSPDQIRAGQKLVIPAG